MQSIHTQGSVTNEMNCFIGYIIDCFRVSYIDLNASIAYLKWFVLVIDQTLEIASLSWEAPLDPSPCNKPVRWPRISAALLPITGKIMTSWSHWCQTHWYFSQTGFPVSVRWKGSMISQSDLQMVQWGSWTRHEYRLIRSRTFSHWWIGKDCKKKIIIRINK